MVKRSRICHIYICVLDLPYGLKFFSNDSFISYMALLDLLNSLKRDEMANLKIWVYKNTWHKFDITDANIMIPVVSTDDLKQMSKA